MDALAGLKVLELGQLIAGPFAGKTLADFGADVIKVEPGDIGDPLRKWRLLRDGTSVWWEVQSRNKRSVCLDLRTPEGQAAVRELAREADVLIENFKPGTLEGWGLGWEQLHALNPRLIMLRISGFGQTGPSRDKPGFGVLGESMGGLRHLTGEPGRVPVRVGVSLGDTLAALHGVIGVLTALHHRTAHGGQGQFIDVALYESVFNVMESLLPEYDAFGVVRERAGSALPGIAPTNAYRCRDGDYVLVAGNGDSIFRRLMRAIGRPDLETDPALKHNDGRVQRAEEIDAAIEAWTRTRGRDDVLAVLDAAGVPVGKIYSVADIASDPQYLARDMIVEARTSDGGTLKVPGIVPKLSATPGRIAHPAPRLGEHNDDLRGGGWPARDKSGDCDEGTPLIDHLDHLVLTTADEAACVRFYVEGLGMSLQTFGAGRRALRFGNQKINLHVKGHEFEPKAHLPTPGALDLCFIASIPLDDVIARLRDRQIDIIEGPVERTGATGRIRSIYVRDPDSNLIEISELVPASGPEAGARAR